MQAKVAKEAFCLQTYRELRPERQPDYLLHHVKLWMLDLAAQIGRAERAFADPSVSREVRIVELSDLLLCLGHTEASIVRQGHPLAPQLFELLAKVEHAQAVGA